jgi:flagellar hook-associated protein 1 FlgK
MAGLFDAISLAKRSMMSQQWAQMITGHNIANVNTPGYSRQRPDLEAYQQTLEIPGGMLGMGSDVAEITRMRNRYLDRQVLSEQQNNGFLQFQSAGLSQIETILGETSGGGLSGILDEFWASWSDVANDPENSSARVALQMKGQELTQNINGVYQNLQAQRRDLDTQLSYMVSDINQISTQIANLNSAISEAVSQGQLPNDLMDQRDLLVDQLAGLANIQTQDENNGSVTVWLGGQNLVYRDTTQSLALREMSGAGDILHEVIWSGSGLEVNFQSGEVAGLLLVRDQAIPELMSGLDQFAVGLAQNVNAIHQTGYALDGTTGLSFFNPSTTGAGNIALSAEVQLNADNIAASSDGNAGDGSIALAIFNLQNELVMDEGQATINQYYASLAADLGSLTQAAETELEQSDVVLDQARLWQASAEGVSLDEEMANMVKYQTTYGALAKFVVTVNEMLDTLLAIT